MPRTRSKSWNPVEMKNLIKKAIMRLLHPPPRRRTTDQCRAKQVTWDDEGTVRLQTRKKKAFCPRVKFLFRTAAELGKQKQTAPYLRRRVHAVTSVPELHSWSPHVPRNVWFFPRAKSILPTAGRQVQSAVRKSGGGTVSRSSHPPPYMISLFLQGYAWAPQRRAEDMPALSAVSNAQPVVRIAVTQALPTQPTVDQDDICD